MKQYKKILFLIFVTVFFGGLIVANRIFSPETIFAEEKEDPSPSFFMPTQVLFSPYTDKAFIVNKGINEITIFDGKEKKLIANLPTSGRGALKMAMDEKNGNLYVINQGESYLTVFPELGLKEDFSPDLVNKYLTVYPKDLSPDLVNKISDEKRFIGGLGIEPIDIAEDQKLQKLYVLDAGSAGSGNLSIIDLNILNQINDRGIINDTKIKIGKRPETMILNPETHKIYIIDSGEGAVFVFNGKTNQLIKSILVGSKPSGFAMGADNKIFVSSMGDNKIYVIDGLKDELITSFVSGGVGPAGMVINNATKKLYIANYYDDTLSVIDASRFTLIKNIVLPVGANPGRPEVLERSNLIFVPNTQANSVSIVDGNRDEVVATLDVGILPVTPAVNPKTGELYIVNYKSSSLSIISRNAEGNFQVQTIPDRRGYFSSGGKFSYPFDIVLNEKTNELYILNKFAGNFIIMDGKGYKVKDMVSVGINPSAIVFSPELSKIFVSNANDDNVFCYNVLDKSKKTIPVGDRPLYLLLNPQTKKLYALNYNSQNISIIDAEKELHLVDIALGGKPPLKTEETAVRPNFQPITMNLKNNKIYIADVINNEIVIMDGSTDQILKRVKVGHAPYNLLYDKNFNYLYVTNRQDNTLMVIDGDSDQIKKTVEVGYFPGYMTLDEGGKKIYIGNRDGIKIFDPVSLEVISDCCPDSYSEEIIISKDGKKIFAYNGIDNFFHIVDLGKNKIFASVPVFGISPSSYLNFENLSVGRLERGVLNSKTNKVFIALGYANAVAVIDANKNRLESVIHNDGIEKISYPFRFKQYIWYWTILAVVIILAVFLGFLYWRKKRTY